MVDVHVPVRLGAGLRLRGAGAGAETCGGSSKEVFLAHTALKGREALRPGALLLLAPLFPGLGGGGVRSLELAGSACSCCSAWILATASRKHRSPYLWTDRSSALVV